MENSSVTMELPANGRKGGWITFPFIIGTMAGLTLASGGWTSNLIVYLIEEFNIKSISAAKIFNFVNGSITMFPIIGAIIADSYVGCFSVIWFASLISLLGTLVILLTAAVNHLRPPPCENGSNICKYPTQFQFAILYLGLALASLGTAGTRFTIAPMGADQFVNPKHQAIFFNWFIFTMYSATVVSSTAIVYVQDTVSWSLGFGLCALANAIGMAVFLCGSRSYRVFKPKGSPFKSLAQVVVAAVSKRRVILSENSEDYYHDHLHTESKNALALNPSPFFRFLNRAALKTVENSNPDGSTKNPWQLCSVQQVEDLKSLIKLSPLWSTCLFLATPLAIQPSLAILQALTMDRHLGHRFKIPAGSFSVFIFISTAAFIFIIDRFLFPLWEKITKRPLTLLQRIGIGHALTIISMGISALVESKRLKVAKSINFLNETNHDNIVSMSALWLALPLTIVGIGEAFHFPGQVALYYQEFPESLKSTSAAVVAMFIGIAFYISNGLIDLIRRVSGWLPDDINEGRIDNVYWICCVLGAVNFAYYLLCSSLYKYQRVVQSADMSIKT